MYLVQGFIVVVVVGLFFLFIYKYGQCIVLFPSVLKMIAAMLLDDWRQF